MTNVDIVDTERERNDKQNKEVLYNIDDLDNFFDDSTISDSENLEHKKDMLDFKNLIAEVDDFKRGMREEYDELQYLIKFVENTSTKINRHKYGVSNLFNQSGLKTVNKLNYDLDEHENSDNDTGKDINQIYNKMKNLNKVKDNLFKIQDNVISYHQNFGEKMKKIEKKNTKHNLKKEKDN
jgi:hypothetical protein